MDATTVAPYRFVVWREVLFAYLAPAVCAGASGLVTGQPDLLRAAPTSIAGTSAFVALLLGIWLRHKGIRPRSPSPIRSAVLAAGSGIGAAALAALTAQILTATTELPERIRIDFPIAAALAGAVITWRWCTIQRKASK
ncbi:hypothetical protein GFY24_13090 [Nocardia sp. SYP-A9097]|uniref:hypothetical protein n=1 Tax=Nocardia sp. SYP-A9097 TaxID=2663237 RepID=UPI00129AC16E|nr:hypothetical protein [Nocardia sp. SYP-A9097]MRH88368.1 hypothetical protein [Nocardia sp. SYP-A9097]